MPHGESNQGGTLKAEELEKRIEDMETLLRLMKERYEEMKRDNEILRRALEELRREKELLGGDNDERRGTEKKAP